jgi:hypothetical protein
VTVDAHAHLGEVVEVVGRTRHELLAGLRDDLPGVLRFGARQSGHVARDEVSQRAQDLRALGCRLASPGRERGLRGGDRRVHFGGTAACDLGQHLLRGRVERFEGGSALDRLAVDQVADVHGGAWVTRGE